MWEYNQTPNSDELYHWKYTKRFWKNGKWNYIYDTVRKYGNMYKDAVSSKDEKNRYEVAVADAYHKEKKATELHNKYSDAWSNSSYNKKLLSTDWGSKLYNDNKTQYDNNRIVADAYERDYKEASVSASNARKSADRLHVRYEQSKKISDRIGRIRGVNKQLLSEAMENIENSKSARMIRDYLDAFSSKDEKQKLEQLTYDKKHTEYFNKINRESMLNAFYRGQDEAKEIYDLKKKEGTVKGLSSQDKEKIKELERLKSIDDAIYDQNKKIFNESDKKLDKLTLDAKNAQYDYNRARTLKGKFEDAKKVRSKYKKIR